jgi:hypothetical protein
MSDRYRIYTSVGVTVYVEDGRVTGVDAENGWSEPTIEAEDEEGAVREVGYNGVDDWKTSEMGQVLDVLSGRWKVEVAP